MAKHPQSGPNPAVQAPAEKTDLSRMGEKYMRTLRAGNPMGRKPMYIDVPADDLQSMMNKVIAAQESFRHVPAKIRTRFQNNPIALITFLQNPENREEGVKMGLIDDPVLRRKMEMEEAAAKHARKRVRQGDVFDPDTGFEQEASKMPKADPESQPNFGKTP